MKKSTFNIFLMGLLIFLLSSLATTGVTAQPAQSPRLQAGTPTAASTNRPAKPSPLRRTPTAQIQPTQPPGQPDIPRVVDNLDFGIPAGNGYHPAQLAIDAQRGRLYSLNAGSGPLDGGNTISLFDLKNETFTGLLKLENMISDQTYTPTPRRLQVDPYRPHLYAIIEQEDESTLFIIDTGGRADSLKIRQALPGVSAIAPGPDRLYLANNSQLWTIDPFSLTRLAEVEETNETEEITARTLEARQFNQALLLDSRSERLYLSRGAPWSVDIFDATTLAPVSRYRAAGEIVQTALDPASQHLFIIERIERGTGRDTNAVQLRALNSDGRPLASPAPIPLADRYTGYHLLLDKNYLYLTSGEYENYQLQTFTLPDLIPVEAVAIPDPALGLALDSQRDRLYASYHNHAILALDLGRQTTQTIYTALTIGTTLADAQTNRLYVLNEQGRLHILKLDDYTLLAQRELVSDRPLTYGPAYRKLALDAGRQRLYISGAPVQILDTETFELTVQPQLRGHITPDPTTDRVYLTPPCRCRMDQCNTLILQADTLTGTQTLFPPEEPMMAECVIATQLDEKNQRLYAHINNGTPGSNSGLYFALFDVSGPPEEIYTNGMISFGDPVFDPIRQRVFVSRWRMNVSALHRYDWTGQEIEPGATLIGAHGTLAYDPTSDRIYVVQGRALLTLDGDLTLLSDVLLDTSHTLSTFDPEGQRLYLAASGGRLLVMATGGGRPQPAPSEPPPYDSHILAQQVIVTGATGETHFRIFDGRLYRSDNQGRSWQILGPGLPDRFVMAMAVSPNYEQDQTLFAGLDTASGYGIGGLYRSTDGGETWQPAMRGLTALNITQIVFSPTFSQDQTIFVSARVHGLFRSTDGGDTWTGLADTYAESPTDTTVDYIALSPTFAADGLMFISRATLLRSSDGGETWTDTHLPGGPVAFSPAYAQDGLVLSEGRWRSTDGGQSWQAAASGLAATEYGAKSLYFSPQFATDQTVYVLLRQSYDRPLILQRSINAGRSWQTPLAGPSSGPDLARLAQVLPRPDNRLTLISGDGEMATIRAGSLNWGRPSIDLQTLDLQDLAISARGTLFVANSTAGVFKSTDAGQTWVETDFPARAGALDPARLATTGEGALFAGIGPIIAHSVDEGASWTQAQGLPPKFEVAALAVSPNFAADGLVIAGGNYTRNDLVRSIDGGRTWQVVFAGSTVSGSSEIAALAFSPNFARDETVYAWLANSGLLRSSDGGQTWELLVDEASRFYAVQSLAVAPAAVSGGDANAGALYLGGLDGRFLVSNDAGQTWRDLGANIPDRRIWSSAIAFGPAGELLLGTDIGLYRSQNGGQTWTRSSAGLPARPDSSGPQAIRALRFDAGKTYLYAAMAEGGVFVSADDGQSWRSTFMGPPPTPAPTPTTAPTPTPTPMPTPTPTPTPAPPTCATPPQYFSDLWTSRLAQLGCPIAGGGQTDLFMAEQAFVGGHLFWRSDTAEIYAFPLNHPYVRVPDTWEGSQPEYTCPDIAPSQTPPTPKRGFGKVWCEQPALRDQLGHVLSDERGVQVTLQEFESGLIFAIPGEVTYILYGRSGGWEETRE